MNTSGFLQPICWDVTHPNQQVSIGDIADIMYFGCIYLLNIDGVDEYRTTQKSLYFESLFKYDQWSIPK